LFPSISDADKPISENATSLLLRRAGLEGKRVPHGWRASFSTIMNELTPANKAIIDLMLAHTAKDKVEAAYNRAQLMVIRREIAQ